MNPPPLQAVAEAKSKVDNQAPSNSIAAAAVANYVPTRKRAVADSIWKVVEEVPSQVAT